MEKKVILSVGVVFISFGMFMSIGNLSDEKKAVATPKEEILSSIPITEVETEQQVEEVLAEEVLLDVPLLNQMDSPRLYNGCEVTSLAMILNFWGIGVTKNELANEINRVPLQYNDGTNGNPNSGFVGDMEDGPGLGVYHDPIFELAKTYVGDRATDLTNQAFDSLLENVAKGSPVWVITTTTFSPVSAFETWTTPQGSVDITFKMHSVVITGYDHEYIYINDPYGTKNKQVDRENFIKAWEQMGSQALVIGALAQ